MSHSVSTLPLDVRKEFCQTLTACIQVEADIAGLARYLAKPLRPLWISQNSSIWIDQVAHPEDLPFTPIVLVSASLPNARQRRFARAPYSHTFFRASPFVDSKDCAAHVKEAQRSREVWSACISACVWAYCSSTQPWDTLGGDQQMGAAVRAGQAGDAEGGWTYEYVPGAGDDEESWARGLTPSLLYTHQEVRPLLLRL